MAYEVRKITNKIYDAVAEFYLNGVRHRIIFRTEHEWEPGYLDPTETHYNVLQAKTLWGWRDVEREWVPGHVIIERGVFGFSSSWRSELIARIRSKYISEWPY